MNTAPARYLKPSEEELLLTTAKLLCPNVNENAMRHLLLAAAASGAFNALLMAQAPQGGVQ